MRVGPGSYEKLNDALELAGTEIVYLSSKREIIGYYTQEYGQNWRAQLAKDLAVQTHERADSIKRRFRGSRLTSEKVTPKAAAEYKQLGKTLPGIHVPRKDIAGRKAKIDIKGDITVSKDKRHREVKGISLTARQAAELRKGNFAPIFEAYGINPDSITAFSADRISVQYQ